MIFQRVLFLPLKIKFNFLLFDRIICTICLVQKSKGFSCPLNLCVKSHCNLQKSRKNYRLKESISYVFQASNHVLDVHIFNP